MFGLFRSTPKVFTAHCLDAKRGYYTTEVVPESDSDAKRLAEFADGNNLYFITHYENGESVENIVPAAQKALWLALKKEHY
jgi:hypothetical protein